MNIPFGYCLCGCGQKTNILTRDWPERGQVKGQPKRFIYRHQGRPIKSAEEVFWSNVKKTKDCWDWLGCKAGCLKYGKGYGQFSHMTKSIRVHRFSWELHNKQKIPAGLFVRHKCDNSICVNPEHLEIGTHEDNMRDMTERKRASSGERHSKAKLTTAQVIEVKHIILRTKAGDDSATAKKFKVGMGVIRGIRYGKTWRNIQPEIFWSPKRITLPG